MIQSVIRLLRLAIKNSTVNPEDIRVGNRIVITNADDDIEGTVQGRNSSNTVQLNTASGVKTIKLSNNSVIHIIKKADMLNLRKHNEYERDLKDMTKEDHQNKGRPEYGPEEKSDKSNLPSSKISLSLRSRKANAKVWYYVDDKGFDSRIEAEKYCDNHNYSHSKIKEEKD